ncbi:cytochrome P450 [Xylaria curta]|nr:cytochrome P450 [Xylaria curta]
MAFLLQLLLAASFAVLLPLTFVLFSRKKVPYPKFPLVGVQVGQFMAWTRALFRSITTTAANANEGYKIFSLRQNLAFSLPSLTYGYITILPPSQLDVLNRPEADLLSHPIQMEVMQPGYLMGDPDELLFKNPIQFDVVRQHMTKDIGFLAASTADEIHQLFSEGSCFTSKQTTAGVWNFCLRIVSRAANRTLFRLPLCRNETLLNRSAMYTNVVYFGSTIISFLPTSMRWLVGPIIGLIGRRHVNVCKRILKPLIGERLHAWCEADSTEMPNDALQWMIQKSARSDPHNLNPDIIAQRLLILQITSIYTTTLALSHILVNLYGSESKDDFVAGLRSECERVAAEHQGLLTKQAIDKLYRMDSTIRESLRVSPFSVIAPIRIVGAEGGIDLDGGQNIPKGARVGAPFQAIHHDDRYYTNPYVFDAFRFSRAFEGSGNNYRQDSEQELTVNVNDRFLSWGYGRHICPGRWYISQTLKQILSYIVENYDIHLKGEREDPKSLLNFIVPPTKSQIKIKKRDHTR